MSAELLDALRVAIQPFIGEDEHSLVDALIDDISPVDRPGWARDVAAYHGQIDALREAWNDYKRSIQ